MFGSDCIGKLVVGFDMSDPDKKVWHIGEAIGYCDRPTIVIDCVDRQIHWVADICRLATHDEEVAYWRDRARTAESVKRVCDVRGDVVVTWAKGEIVAVTRQDEEGRILSMIAEKSKPPVTSGVKPTTPPGYSVAPKELWLQLHGDCHESELEEPVDYEGSDDVTWCWHPIHNTDVRYVRADIAGVKASDVHSNAAKSPEGNQT